MEYVAPTFKMNGFNCPLCNAYAQISWVRINSQVHGISDPRIWQAECTRCRKSSIWKQRDTGEALHADMIFPVESNAPIHHKDLPDECKPDYMEARSIEAQSPRAAAALLRLVVQKLCKHFGQPGKDINKDIGNLVQEGLPRTLQQALDTVRVVGNEAVHPGEIDLNDNPEIVSRLFRLVNRIVEKMITEPKEDADLYASLPASKLEGIDQRDKPKQDN
ncbi:DUF4145 domain-containing protein [Chromobacterium sp. LK1]|uniref:DUF4145 domain-containing protein n=1 Tax=Chromobacterium sp. LK1 TaxID=1628193 RepID=UPI000AD4F427|nr:DUF4145 domain-containing protein [Chromobacterium sp. LK1]